MSKIRPYTKEEADMFIGEVAKSKHDGKHGIIVGMVTGFNDKGVIICGDLFDYYNFCRLFVWNDGSVCGIEEDEK